MKDGNQQFTLNEQTALQIATKNGHYKVVCQLIDKYPKIRDTIVK